MLNSNLGLTMRIAYALSTVLILFLSSAFLSLAHAQDGVTPEQPKAGFSGSMGSVNQDDNIDYDFARFRKRWEMIKNSQKGYVERWYWRECTYSSYEDWADWLRRHGYYDGESDPQWAPGGGGGPFFSAMFFNPVNLPTFVDMIIDIF